MSANPYLERMKHWNRESSLAAFAGIVAMVLMWLTDWPWSLLPDAAVMLVIGRFLYCSRQWHKARDDFLRNIEEIKEEKP